jgi:hypothetical protein
MFLAHFGVMAQEIPSAYQHVSSYLNKKGDFKDGVFKLSVPRTDLKVTIDGIEAPTAFGFGGWLAMTKGDKNAEVMMGDLVLLEDEVNPVMSALLENGLEVTALHNHFFWEEPRIFYMHVHGFGSAKQLARQVKPALDLIGVKSSRHRSERGTASGTSDVSPNRGVADTMSTNALARIIGHQGERFGPVYKITIGRPDIDLREMGARINARMGLNTWAAFFGSDQKAAIAGDVAMLEEEVTNVLKALRKHGLDVVAIHHHMTGGRPMIIFLHYWGTGPAEQLALGFRAALDELGKKPARAPMTH